MRRPRGQVRGRRQARRCYAVSMTRRWQRIHLRRTARPRLRLRRTAISWTLHPVLRANAPHTEKLCGVAGTRRTWGGHAASTAGSARLGHRGVCDGRSMGGAYPVPLNWGAPTVSPTPERFEKIAHESQGIHVLSTAGSLGHVKRACQNQSIESACCRSSLPHLPAMGGGDVCRTLWRHCTTDPCAKVARLEAKP